MHGAAVHTLWLAVPPRSCLQGAAFLSALRLICLAPCSLSFFSLFFSLLHPHTHTYSFIHRGTRIVFSSKSGAAGSPRACRHEQYVDTEKRFQTRVVAPLPLSSCLLRLSFSRLAARVSMTHSLSPLPHPRALAFPSAALTLAQCCSPSRFVSLCPVQCTYRQQ